MRYVEWIENRYKIILLTMASLKTDKWLKIQIHRKLKVFIYQTHFF